MADVSNNYARALVDVIISTKLDAALAFQQLEVFAELFRSSPELRNVWESPSVAPKQKLSLLDAIASGEHIAKPVRNFVAVLMDHGRLGMLPQISERFKQELHRRLGLVEAQVTSARELSADEKRTLEQQIAKVTGRKVSAQYQQDAALLGGAVVRVGSTIYDGSVSGQLERLKQQISSS